jgi:hypothetical protein
MHVRIDCGMGEEFSRTKRHACADALTQHFDQLHVVRAQRSLLVALQCVQASLDHVEPRGLRCVRLCPSHALIAMKSRRDESKEF